MTAPTGWYPDPSGMPMRRYFDGDQWTEDYAPLDTSSTTATKHRKPKFAWLFSALAIGGLAVATITFILMQFAFSSPALWSDLSAAALFIAWLVSLVAMAVGIIGTIVRLLRRR